MDMIDQEKVIRGLECCIKQGENDIYCRDLDCPYQDENDSCRLVCWTKLNKDALSLLKAQEPNMSETLWAFFEKQKKAPKPGSASEIERIETPENLPEFIKKWCIPMLGAESYFPKLFGQYGHTICGICDDWCWYDEKLEQAPESDLWAMLAISSTFWWLNYAKWYDDLKAKRRRAEHG